MADALRAEATRLPPGLDVVIVARPDALELVEREGLAGVQAAISELVDKISGDRE